MNIYSFACDFNVDYKQCNIVLLWLVHKNKLNDFLSLPYHYTYDPIYSIQFFHNVYLHHLENHNI